MRIVVLFSRLLLGAVFFAHGLNIFLHFVTIPAPVGTAAVLAGGLAASGYFFPFLGMMEILCGGLLLLGRFVPLALVMLAPLVLHILAFHSFVAPSGLLVAIVLVSLTVLLAIAYRDSFREVLRSDAQPTFGRGAPSRHMVEGRKSRPPDVREPIEA
jgi:uncharacterized membrane protein YphA (DoxX/SURF4 family)